VAYQCSRDFPRWEGCANDPRRNHWSSKKGRARLVKDPEHGTFDYGTGWSLDGPGNIFAPGTRIFNGVMFNELASRRNMTFVRSASAVWQTDCGQTAVHQFRDDVFWSFLSTYSFCRVFPSHNVSAEWFSSQSHSPIESTTSPQLGPATKATRRG